MVPLALVGVHAGATPEKPAGHGVGPPPGVELLPPPQAETASANPTKYGSKRSSVNGVSLRSYGGPAFVMAFGSTAMPVKLVWEPEKSEAAPTGRASPVAAGAKAWRPCEQQT